jgi:hypothetical protein
MALVDDCIQERWQTKKVHNIPIPLTSKKVKVDISKPKSFMQTLFGWGSKRSKPMSAY